VGIVVLTNRLNSCTICARHFLQRLACLERCTKRKHLKILNKVMQLDILSTGQFAGVTVKHHAT